MKMVRMDSIIFQAIARQALYVVIVFSLFLLGRGHNEPGGGFIGGLMTAAAIVIQYLAFDLESVKKAIPFDGLKLVALGLSCAVGTGLVTMFAYGLFMDHVFAYIQLPFFGQLQLTTAFVFDLGVYFVVVGGIIAIITAIGEER